MVQEKPARGLPQVEAIMSLGTVPAIIADPGDAGAIDVSTAGYCELTTAGAETRTLADPVFKGQEIDLVFIADGGDCVITAAPAINQTGNTIMTFSAIGESIRLMGHWNATDGWEWVAISLANGVALS